MKSKAFAFKLGHVRGNTMLTQWVVMVLKCNVLCHLQHCKCPDQDLWAPGMPETVYVITLKLLHAFHKLILAKLTHGCSLKGPAYDQGHNVRIDVKDLAQAPNACIITDLYERHITPLSSFAAPSASIASSCLSLYLTYKLMMAEVSFVVLAVRP